MSRLRLRETDLSKPGKKLCLCVGAHQAPGGGFQSSAGEMRGLSWFFQRWGISQDAWLRYQVWGPAPLTPARAEPGKTELLMHAPEVELGIILGARLLPPPRPLTALDCGQRSWMRIGKPMKRVCWSRCQASCELLLIFNVQNGPMRETFIPLRDEDLEIDRC